LKKTAVAAVGLGIYPPSQDLQRTIRNRIRKGMVEIPAGPFLMGEDGDWIAWCPRHERETDSYRIMKRLVRWNEYKVFCRVTGRSWPRNPRGGTWRDDEPAVFLTFHEIVDFAQWLGMTLPTEEEWEKAMRGVDGRQFPWGDGPYPAGRYGRRPVEWDVSPFGVMESLRMRRREWTLSVPHAYGDCPSPWSDFRWTYW
jgi:formylglycine-generating enzyme required for sulfatase activity